MPAHRLPPSHRINLPGDAPPSARRREPPHPWPLPRERAGRAYGRSSERVACKGASLMPLLAREDGYIPGVPSRQSGYFPHAMWKSPRGGGSSSSMQGLLLGRCWLTHCLGIEKAGVRVRCSNTDPHLTCGGLFWQGEERNDVRSRTMRHLILTVPVEGTSGAIRLHHHAS